MLDLQVPFLADGVAQLLHHLRDLVALLVEELVDVLLLDLESLQGRLDDQPRQLLVVLGVVVQQGRHQAHQVAHCVLQEVCGEHLEVVLVEVEGVLAEEEGVGSLLENYLEDGGLRADVDLVDGVDDLSVHFL